MSYLFFFFNHTATTEIYTLSLHDALPIWGSASLAAAGRTEPDGSAVTGRVPGHQTRRGTRKSPGSMTSARSRRSPSSASRSEEHTSELQSQSNLVCRLLLEKKKKKKKQNK